jgi:hypothetical protein
MKLTKRKRRPRRAADPQKLVRELLSRMPDITNVPPEIQGMIAEAVDAAENGDTRPLEMMLAMMNEIETNAFADQQRCSPLCSPEAAEVLDALDSENELASGTSNAEAAAQQALMLDPFAIDALVLLGEFAKLAQTRVEYFRRASEAASHKDSAIVAQVMPAFRFRMGSQLVDDGRLVDAAEVMMPGLDEDPKDRQGLRFALIDLALRLGWEDELDSILERYSDDRNGPVSFARALVMFRRGASRQAKALLAVADEAHPEVAPILGGLQGAEDPNSDAAIIAGYLLPGVRATPGASRWIRDTLDLRHANDQEDFGCEDEFDDGELLEFGRSDPLGMAIDLPASDKTWQLAIHRITDSDVANYLAVILDGEDLVSIESFAIRPKTGELRRFVLSSVTAPADGRPRKPAVLNVPNKAAVTALTKYCGTLGFSCHQQKAPKEFQLAIESMLPALIRMIESTSGDAVATDDDAALIDLNDLPLSDDAWLFGVFKPPIWIHDRATPRRAWLQLVTDANSGCVMGSEITEQQPSPADIARTLQKTMAAPLVGRPRRAAKLLADPLTDLAGIDEFINTVPIESGQPDLKVYFDKVITDMLLSQGPVDQALHQQDGVSHELLAELYESAATFCRAEPWMMVGIDHLFEVSCPGWQVQRWTGCVIGQLGQELGLALYDEPEAIQRAIAEDDLSNMNAVVIHFGEAFETIPVDLWYIERNDLRVTGPEGYPFVSRVRSGRDLVCPSLADLTVLGSVLKHLLRFLDHPRDAPMQVDPQADSQGIRFKWIT